MHNLQSMPLSDFISWIVGVIVALVIGGFIYLLPSVVAYSRQHKNLGAIEALNVLLGWTFLGWVAAFVWAMTSNTEPPDPPSAR